MTSDDAVILVIRALNALPMPYMITGSLASNLYGVARSTKDADLILQTTEFDFCALRRALEPSLRIDPQMSFETVTGTTRYIVRKVEGDPYTIELFFLSSDLHDQERFARRAKGLFVGEDVWVATPEDVIITKLRWSKQGKRSKDIDDVRNVIAVQQGRIDWTYVNRWCDEHGTRELLERVRSSIPKI